jgi:arylsulfatase A-like enzyme
LPPWSVPDELLDEFFGADPDAAAEDDASKPDEAGVVEPWTGELPDRIDPDDEVSFQRLRRTYAAAVAGLDEALGRLTKDFDKGGWGDAVLILTSDAGFPLGEHGAVGPAQAGLYEEFVHSPLILSWPGGEHAGLRVAGLTQPPDLIAAVGDWFGRSASTPGLVRLAREQAGSLRSHATCTLKVPRTNSWSVRTRDWYLLATDAPETTRRLYVKPDDRWEFNDVAQHHPETVAELEKVYREQHP